MTKKQFERFEKICKEEIWGELAKTGSSFKPKIAYNFEYDCPACEIAQRTQVLFKQREKDERMPCEYCPIDVWRKRAVNNIEQGTCVRKGKAFNKWRYSSEINKGIREKEALKIANYSWSFLPEYKKIKGYLP